MKLSSLNMGVGAREALEEEKVILERCLRVNFLRSYFDLCK